MSSRTQLTAHMELFTQIGILLVGAALLSLGARLLKQPAIVAYILTGLLAGSFLIQTCDIWVNQAFIIFSELGITILLFIVGINLSPKSIKTVGKNAFVAGGAQIILTTFLAYVLAKFLGFAPVEAIVLSIAFSFSSTVVVLKLLSDLGDLEKLHAKLAIGILLAQDILASVCLIFLAAVSNAHNGTPTILLLFAKGAGLFVIIWFVGTRVLAKFSKLFAKSQENLFLFSVAWGFGVASIFMEAGFSKEVRALIAGVSLSALPYSTEIASKLKPLRDFFVILFFISLGSKISGPEVMAIIPQALIFSLFVIVVKPILTGLLVNALGYNSRVSFNTGVSLAQISEFSLVFLLLALKLGYVQPGSVGLTTLVLIGTIVVSSYLIKYSNKLEPVCSQLFRLTNKSSLEERISKIGTYDVILLGCNRVGWDFVKTFMNLGTGFLVVDYNPKTVEELKKKDVNAIYGDAEDTEFLEEVGASRAKMVISTIPDFETSSVVLEHIRGENPDSAVVLISYNVDEALSLYDKGATYVILPHFISAQHAVKMLEEFGIGHKNFEQEKNNHITYLKERKTLGLFHPPH